MKITDRGVMAAVVRNGDYLVFRSDRSGIAVEYSPGAPAGSPVIGAFAAHKGRIKFYDAAEASTILQNYTIGAEEHLAAEMDRTAPTKEKTLADKVVDALKTYADAGYSRTAEHPRWDGKLSEFHKEVLYPALGLAYSSNLIKAVQKAASMVPGVVVAKLDNEMFITVEWGDLST